MFQETVVRIGKGRARCAVPLIVLDWFHEAEGLVEELDRGVRRVVVVLVKQLCTWHFRVLLHSGDGAELGRRCKLVNGKRGVRVWCAVNVPCVVFHRQLNSTRVVGLPTNLPSTHILDDAVGAPVLSSIALIVRMILVDTHMRELECATTHRPERRRDNVGTGGTVGVHSRREYNYNVLVLRRILQKLVLIRIHLEPKFVLKSRFEPHTCERKNRV